LLAFAATMPFLIWRVMRKGIWRGICLGMRDARTVCTRAID
jgi:hypothetical protein